MSEINDIPTFYRDVTGYSPFPYQQRLAEEPIRSRLIRVPTGAGKTAAAIVAWLWRRKVDPENTPRRLVYCLPMRVLVEQTRDVAKEWAEKSGLDIPVYTLMGGEVEDAWEFWPERPAILVGTQDILLSRALNRGYAMNRYRWPVHFGLLNNDCLWVCDEVQLMGSGLATTTQLQVWREEMKSCGPTATWWMSATADARWLATIDFQEQAARIDEIDASVDAVANDEMRLRCNAPKPVEQIARLDAAAVLRAHEEGRLTLVVVNTVARARALYQDVHRTRPDALLLHSRFRPAEREGLNRRLRECAGGIIIATQVVEAGVDLSADVLITELAPWASLVQRFGRQNRNGRQHGSIRWVDLGPKDSAPYSDVDLKNARERLKALPDSDARIAHLEKVPLPERDAPVYVARRHDLHGLFSTEQDLAGGFTDVSRFVRDSERKTDVYVFWREFKGTPAAGDLRPDAQEICTAPIGALGKLLEQTGAAWEWNPEEERPARIRHQDLKPGMTVLLGVSQGGYLEDAGWTGREEDRPHAVEGGSAQPDGLKRDRWSEGAWLPLIEHLRDAESEAGAILSGLGLDETLADAVLRASAAHDIGKALPGWQNAIPADRGARPGAGLWAKFPNGGDPFRPGLRHEAASGLAAWQEWQRCVPGWSGLAVYLTAAHHGKVRTVLRATRDADIFGLREGDEVPAVPGWSERACSLDFRPRLFGVAGDWDDEHGTFAPAMPSWVGVVAELLGPELPGDPAGRGALRTGEPCGLGAFRLAFLEALVAAADVRASQHPGAGRNAQ